MQIVRMIICVCRSLNTSKVVEAIEAGARSPAQVHRHHNTTINCGKCSETVCDMLRECGVGGCSGDLETMAIAAE